ncbi:MAG TPA: hypothetical protein VIK18_06215 [Pirellulales bacterium]
MAKCGRRPVLDDAKRREICAVLSMGGSRRLAARYVGCSPATISNTAERDPGFSAQLDQAEGQHELLYLRNIQAAAKKEQYWRAAAWMLERRYPERYAQRRPGAITVEQIIELLSQFAEIVVQELPHHDDQQRVLGRLELLGANLETG